MRAKEEEISMRIRILKKKLSIHLTDQSGFTLMEMLIVIALIGLIGTFVTTNVISKFQRAKVDATRIQMRNLGTVLDDYKDCNSYPSSEQGLMSLVEKPTSAPECKNYNPDGYLKEKKAPNVQ